MGDFVFREIVELVLYKHTPRAPFCLQRSSARFFANLAATDKSVVKVAMLESRTAKENLFTLSSVHPLFDDMVENANVRGAPHPGASIF